MHLKFETIFNANALTKLTRWRPVIMQRHAIITMVLTISLFLVSCVTTMGHRQIISEDNLRLEIISPTNKTKLKIRFNTEQSQLEYLPDGVIIRLSLADNKNTHHIKIESVNGEPKYEYEVDGRQVIFGPKEQEWFSSQIPTIVRKLDIGASSLETEAKNNKQKSQAL